MKPVGELPFIAGHPALDFVNTAEERGHPNCEDALRSPADLRLWGRRYGLLSSDAGGSRDERSELQRALEARELLYAILLARVQKRSPGKPLLDRLANLAGDAYTHATLEAADGGQVRWRWDPDRMSSVRHVAVTSGLELLGGQQMHRLKQCPGDHCGWFFLDTTKRGNRRWCSMDDCGQEAKTARRRTRRQSGSGARELGLSASMSTPGAA